MYEYQGGCFVSLTVGFPLLAMAPALTLGMDVNLEGAVAIEGEGEAAVEGEITVEVGLVLPLLLTPPLLSSELSSESLGWSEPVGSSSLLKWTLCNPQGKQLHLRSFLSERGRRTSWRWDHLRVEWLAPW